MLIYDVIFLFTHKNQNPQKSKSFVRKINMFYNFFDVFKSTFDVSKLFFFKKLFLCSTILILGAVTIEYLFGIYKAINSEPNLCRNEDRIS